MQKSEQPDSGAKVWGRSIDPWPYRQRFVAEKWKTLNLNIFLFRISAIQSFDCARIDSADVRFQEHDGCLRSSSRSLFDCRCHFPWSHVDEGSWWANAQCAEQEQVKFSFLFLYVISKRGNFGAVPTLSNGFQTTWRLLFAIFPQEAWRCRQLSSATRLLSRSCSNAFPNNSRVIEKLYHWKQIL